ncbi:hypothetical protein [Ponticaulis profundi]|uniref:Uncharacterized protein n=1 Tax=Ponticaulis profundi TaxID=2665222 RepID=A0ABW1S4X5_9PROT
MSITPLAFGGGGGGGAGGGGGGGGGTTFSTVVSPGCFDEHAFKTKIEPAASIASFNLEFMRPS